MTMATLNASVSSLQIESFSPTDKARIRELVLFPFRLYAGDPNWVPPFIGEREDFVNPAKNPFYEHADIQFFLARRQGEVVGTIMACVNHTHNQVHNERTGSFGFFETVDDPDVAAALLQAVEAWVRGKGMTMMRGPMSFSANDEWGLLIDGFHEPPMVLTTYNKPYYQGLIEGCGYTKAMDLFGYIGDLDERLHSAPPKVFRAAEKAAKARGVTVRKGRIREFEVEADRVKIVINQSLSKNWGYVPVSDHEAMHLGKSLKPIIDPDLVLIAENEKGEPVGASFTLPDLHQPLRWSGGGRMFPFGLLRFLWAKRRTNQIRLVMIGVVEEYRSLGLDAIFYVETARNALAKGYRRIEGSWVLEVNTMMNRIINRLGGKHTKTWRIFEKRLAQGEFASPSSPSPLWP